MKRGAKTNRQQAICPRCGSRDISSMMQQVRYRGQPMMLAYMVCEWCGHEFGHRRDQDDEPAIGE